MSNLPRHRAKSYRRDAVDVAIEAWSSPYSELEPIEEQFRQAAREVAQRLGYRCYHHRDSRGSDVGWPDEVWLRPPRLIFAELKSPRGDYTDDQRDTLELLGRIDGVEAYGIRSTGDRARDQASIAELLSPRGRPARILPRGKEVTG